MKIAFDLDDTLCWREPGIEHLGPQKYDHSKPIDEMRKLVNDLYNEGHEITIYTSRGMTQFQGDIKIVYSELFEKTLNWLKNNGFNFHQLVMGKIHYDLLIDDKAISAWNHPKYIKGFIDEKSTRS